MTRWPLPPLLWLSALLHVGALGALPWHAASWPWLLGAVMIDHLVIMAVSLWPRSTWLGPNLHSLPAAAQARNEVAITIDDGPDPEVTPQVLALLNQYGAKATFFCIGERASRHADICRALANAGHEIGNHGQKHPWRASLMGPRGWMDEVGEGSATLAAITGMRPRYYRAVAGLRNPFLEPVLRRLDLSLASWTRRGFDTRTGDADLVLRRLTRGLAAGDILLLHDGHAARTPDGQPVILAVLPRLLEALSRRQLKAVTLSEACTSN